MRGIEDTVRVEEIDGGRADVREGSGGGGEEGRRGGGEEARGRVGKQGSFALAQNIKPMLPRLPPRELPRIPTLLLVPEYLAQTTSKCNIWHRYTSHLADRLL